MFLSGEFLSAKKNNNQKIKIAPPFFPSFDHNKLLLGAQGSYFLFLSFFQFCDSENFGEFLRKLKKISQILNWPKKKKKILNFPNFFVQKTTIGGGGGNT